MTDADVIVVGGGHNGLICAAYLARSDLDVMVLESRPAVGGCASTVSDLGARFNICHCEHTLVRTVPVIDELDLAAHGLEYLEPDAGTIFLHHDDAAEPWVQYHEAERTIEGLAAAHRDQVDGYRRYLADALPVAGLILEMARTRPSAFRLTLAALRQRGEGAARLLEWSRNSFAEVFARYFDDWRMTMAAVSAGPTAWGISPEQPGSGLAAASFATRHLVRSGRPRGGSGALTEAVRSSFAAAGGTVRCGARVESLLIRDGVVTGVRLADATELTATAVVAACDPHRVYVDWVGDPPPAARRQVARWRARPVQEGYESKIDAVLSGRPTLRAGTVLGDRNPGLDVMNPTMVVLPTPEQLAFAHRGRREGFVADRPTLLVNFPSVLDPEMVPAAGAHVASIEVLYTPYSLVGGWPGSDEPRRWLDLWADQFEPGALDQVTEWRAMTPDRYESDFEMHRGHTPTFAGTPLAALFGHPQELTRYRTAIAGLYLTGAGTFPGAGVSGAPGRNAADVVRSDLRDPVGRRLASVRRWRSGRGRTMAA